MATALGGVGRGVVSEEAVDEVLAHLDHCFQQLRDVQGHSRVKQPAAELQLLGALDRAREQMLGMLSEGSRDSLRRIFGGDCVRVSKLRIRLDSLQRMPPSDLCESSLDRSRIDSCLGACESVERVLMDAGLSRELQEAKARERQALEAQQGGAVGNDASAAAPLPSGGTASSAGATGGGAAVQANGGEPGAFNHTAPVPPVRLLVRATAGARVVGKGGESIRALRNLGASVKVFQDELPEALKRRNENIVVASSGEVSILRTAVVGILERVFDRSGLPDAVERSRERPFVVDVLIPERAAGPIVGPGGERVKALMEELSCTIDVVREPVAGFVTHRRVRLLSRDRAIIDRAVMKIQQVLGELLASGALATEDFDLREAVLTEEEERRLAEAAAGGGEVPMRLLLAPGEAAVVVGRMGYNIARLRDVAHVSIDEVSPPLDPNCRICLVGRAVLADRLRAVRLVLADLALSLSLRLGDDSGNLTIRLLLPTDRLNDVAAMLTPVGIARLSEQTGAFVQEQTPPSQSTPTWRVIEIRGQEEQVAGVVWRLHRALEPWESEEMPPKPSRADLRGDDRDGERSTAAPQSSSAGGPSPELNSIHHGEVARLQPFGAFVRLPGYCDGLCHVSQLRAERTERPEDIVTVGQRVWVKVVEIRDGTRVSLSMRAVDQSSGRDLEPMPAPGNGGAAAASVAGFSSGSAYGGLGGGSGGAAAAPAPAPALAPAVQAQPSSTVTGVARMVDSSVASTASVHASTATLEPPLAAAPAPAPAVTTAPVERSVVSSSSPAIASTPIPSTAATPSAAAPSNGSFGAAARPPMATFAPQESSPAAAAIQQPPVRESLPYAGGAVAAPQQSQHAPAVEATQREPQRSAGGDVNGSHAATSLQLPPPLVVAVPNLAVARFLVGEPSGIARRANVQLSIGAGCGDGMPVCVELRGKAEACAVACYLIQVHLWLLGASCSPQLFMS